MYPKGHSPEDLRAHFEKKHGKPLEDVDHETLRKSFLAHVDEHPDAAEGMMDLHGDMAGWKRPTMKKPGMKESLKTIFPKLSSLLEKKSKEEHEDFADSEMEEAGEEAEEKPMGKAEVLAALKDMTPADRKAVHTKLMAMVEADEAEAE
jgi:hypothetical protein